MTRDQIAIAAATLCTAYNRELTPALITLLADDYREWGADEFATCVQAHRRDPERGRFFPTLADLEYQRRGDRAQAKEIAAESFDLNPLIDGTSKFDADRETYEQRDRRKRAWITRAAYEFEGADIRTETPQISGPRRGLIGKGYGGGSIQ